MEWQPQLRVIQVKSGQLLTGGGTLPNYFYFPVSALVALTVNLENGSGVDFALVGSEGFIGLEFITENDAASFKALVQAEGSLYQVRSAFAHAQFNKSTIFRVAILNYMRYLIAESGQNSTCFRHHSIEQQVCRLLLRYMDRQKSMKLALTHEIISRSLGVRRESVTLVSQKLRRLDLITSSNGLIQVKSVSGLQSLSCECYEVMKQWR